MNYRISVAFVALCLTLSACEREEKVAPARSKAPGSGVTEGGGQGSARFALAGLTQQAAVGAAGSIAFEVTPTKPLKINPEFPWKLTLQGSPAELGLGATVISQESMSFSTSKATVPIAVHPSVAGTYTIEGTLDLSVCEADGARRCFLERGKPVSIVVEATASSPE